MAGGERLDGLLRGALVWDPDLGLRRADLRVGDGRIVDCAPALTPGAAEAVLDLRGALVLPAFANLHTHSHSYLLAGQAGRWSVEDLQCAGPGLYAGLSPDDAYTGTLLSALEMMRAGVVAANDMVMGAPALTTDHVDAMVQAYVDAGIKAVVTPAVADLSLEHALREWGSGSEWLSMGDPPDWSVSSSEMIELTRAAIRRWSGAGEGRIHVDVGPMLPVQCSDDLLDRLRDLAAAEGTGIHTHVNESRVHCALALARWGRSAVQHLARLGLLDRRAVLAHAVWLEAADLEALAGSGAVVSHNPTSNLRLGSGACDVRALRAAGVSVGLGTDGANCSDHLNMFEVVRAAAFTSRIGCEYRQDEWLSAGEALGLATTHGWPGLPHAPAGGRLRSGASADLAILDLHAAPLAVCADPVAGVVYREGGRSLSGLLVRGRWLLRDGEVLTVDEEAALQRGRRAAQTLHRDATSPGDGGAPEVRAACAALLRSPQAVQAPATEAEPAATDGS